MTSSAKTISPHNIRTSSVELLDAATLCHRLAGKGPHPFVELRMGGEVGGLRCRATHGSAGIEVDVVARADTSETVVVSSGSLVNALKACRKGLVYIEVDGSHVSFTDAVGFTVTMLNLRANDQEVPKWPDRAQIVTMGKIPAAIDFGTLLRQVGSHASEDSGRINIYAVYFEHDGERGYVCATDGHRMALATRKFFWPQLKGIRISPDVLPFVPPQQALVVTVCKDTVFIATDTLRLWGRLGNGTFPSFREVIPDAIGQKDTPMLSADRIELFKAAAAFEKIRVNSTSIELRATDEILEMRTNGDLHDRPIGHQKIDVEGTKPCEESIVINANYLHEAGQVLGDGVVQIYWNHHLEPLVLSDRPGKDAYNLVVIMPVRY